jgi:hypothetical protein
MRCHSCYLLQARAAELLQVHTELRQVLHGRHAALRRLLPAPAPLDVLRFLQLWDYEAGLTAQVGGCLRQCQQRPWLMDGGVRADRSPAPLCRNATTSALPWSVRWCGSTTSCAVPSSRLGVAGSWAC